MVNYNWHLKRIINYEKRWVEKVSEDNVIRFTPYINAIFADNSRKSFFLCGANIDCFSYIYGIRGEVLVLNGDASGWASIYRSIQYMYYSVVFKMMVKFYQPEQYFNLYGELVDAANCLSALITYELFDEAEYIGLFMQKSLAYPEYIDIDFWNSRTFEPFIYQLYSMYGTTKIDPRLVSRDLGVYSGVIRFWDDPVQLTSVMIDLCNYHCKKMWDYTGISMPEFFNAPFALVPFEILAIYKLRDRLGLPTPRIDHPLMNSPLVQFYPTKFEGKDAVLTRLQEQIDHYFPAEIRMKSNE